MIEEVVVLDDVGEVGRPLPSVEVSERVRAWLEWFGLGRLIGSAVATAVVCAGAYWLVRSPPPPTEAALPTATAAAAPATLPEPDQQGVESTTPAPVSDPWVHVAGAVERPGVYRLGADARVDDAVAAAGGPSSGADLDRLNLAAVIEDGSRVFVPTVGEEIVPVVEIDVAAPSGGGPGDAVSTGPIDLNLATTVELETLPGIGPATATAIVTERERNGPFSSVDDLERVPGIGPAKLAALSGLVTT